MRFHVVFIAVLCAGAGALLWHYGRSSEPSAPPAAVARARAEAAASPASGRMLRPAPPRLPDLAPAPAQRTPARSHAHDDGATPPSRPDLPAGEDTAMLRALVHEALARDLPRKLPALDLSAADMERLSDAMVRVRDHQLRLRRLEHTRKNAAEIQRRQQMLIADLRVFEDVTGMSASDLTNALSDEGITAEDQDHAEPAYRTLPAPAR